MPLEPIFLRELAAADKPAAEALTRRAHDLLVKAHPKHASYEDADVWVERILGGGSKVDQFKSVVPELHIAVLKDPSVNDDILGFIYSELHHKSLTAQSQYHHIAEGLSGAARERAKAELVASERAMLTKAAADRGGELKAIFEQTMDKNAPFHDGRTVNIDNYVSPPYFNYDGKPESLMAAERANLRIVGKGHNPTPADLRGFIEDHASYNATASSKDLALKSPEWANVEAQVTGIEAGEKPLFSRIARGSEHEAGR